MADGPERGERPSLQCNLAFALLVSAGVAGLFEIVVLMRAVHGEHAYLVGAAFVLVFWFFYAFAIPASVEDSAARNRLADRGAAARMIGISLAVLTIFYFVSQILVALLNTASLAVTTRWLSSRLVLGAYAVDAVLLTAIWLAWIRKVKRGEN